MATERKKLLSFSVSVLLTMLVIPAYAEVESLQTDRLFYVKNDKITFSGTVDEDSTGLVTIVIRDSNDKFVLLAQALIQPDNTYKKSVDANTKFGIHGIYNATAFIQNMTAGAITQFDFSTDGSPVVPSVSDFQNNPEPETESVTKPETELEPETESSYEIETESTTKLADFVDPEKEPQHYVDRYNNEPAYKDWFDRNYPDITIEVAVGFSIEDESESTTKIPNFPDPEKEPQHYVDRYNNEPAYKDWFDRNFPGQTIYDIVGNPNNEEVEAAIQNSTATEPLLSTQETLSLSVPSSVGSSGSEFSQMLLALGGLGILFGAVYGIKRRVDNNTEQIKVNKSTLQKRVDHNSEQISQNRFWLKKKLMSLRSCDEPVNVIKERLAKGEITLDEYYKLLRALKKP